jgi:guanylate kinase
VGKDRGDLFVVSAPSGAGKTTLCRKLISILPDITHSVSYTTRAPRSGEVNDRDYSFISETDFRRMADEGQFAEWAEVHGNLYGTSKSRLEDTLEKGMDIILDVDVQGARQLRESYPGGVYVFILPPSMEALAERLRSRMSDSPGEIKRRLEKAGDEIEDYVHYNYVIVNNIFEEALKELEVVVISRRPGSGRVDSKGVKRNFLKQEEG